MGASVARLALAVGEEVQLGAGRVGFRIPSRTGVIAHRAFGQSIVIYQRAAEALLFVGSGRVIGLDLDAPDFDVLRLGDYRAFSPPVLSAIEDEVRDPGVRRSLSLDDDRFEEIVQAAADASEQALAEAQALFLQDREAALGAYLKIHDRVLQRWSYRCAFTGAQFSPSKVRPHPGLRVVAIRPRELGGPLHVRNYLPMVPDAERAWTHGHITLGPSFGFQVSERLIDPELHECLLPLGRLALSEEPSLWPALELIAYHRAHIFDRD